MLKTLVSFLLIFSVFGSKAHAGHVLESALQEFQYSVMVEWDQKDESFLKEKQEELAQAVKDSGLTQAQVIDFTKSQFKDSLVAADVGQLLTAASLHKMSMEEVQRRLIESLRRSEVKGANWASGDTDILFFTCLLAGLGIGLFALEYFTSPHV